MKIILSDYQLDACVDVQHRYNPKDLDLEFVDLKYLKDLDLDGTIERSKEALTFQGRLVTDVEYVCGRCLRTLPGHVDQPFQLFYETHGREMIDATNDLREVLILNHPLAYLCSENCKGLCAGCGMNLNEEKCRCKNQSALLTEESPFKAILRKFKEGKKNG